MKKTAIVFFSFVALSSVLLAQKKAPAQANKPSIELVGAKLHLGMTKADVAERYVGTQVTKVNEDFWIIGKVGMSGTCTLQERKVTVCRPFLD